MGKRVQTTASTDSDGHAPLPGDHPGARRKPVGRHPKECINQATTAEAFVAFLRGVFPELGRWFDALPDARRQELCKYTGAHIWFHILMMFVTRAGSCNAFDQTRNSGAAPANMGALCGQGPEDYRFAGQPTVTCSDNAGRHAGRTQPEAVAEIPVKMIRLLMERRLFDPFRLLDVWHVLVVDGTVQEKCREGFTDGGKRAGTGTARYRYVLQLGILGPNGMFLPFMHEAVDMHDPVRDKEDCELEAFKRLMPRLKACFPRTPFCIVGDALYATEGLAALCERMGWRYVFTLKEGRQPGAWDEMLELLAQQPGNKWRLWRGTKPEEGLRDMRWIDSVPLGEKGTTNVLLEGEITEQAATLYAWITNFGHLTAERVLNIVNAAGRERHRIEDHFNAQKNNGIGLGHVFRANPDASKNYYSIMQVAQLIWQLFYGGHLARLYEWARAASQQVLARAVGEGIRASLFASVPPIGQLRFVT
jgi:hypothetical protein